MKIFTNTEEKKSKRSRTLRLSIRPGVVSGKSFTKDNFELKKSLLLVSQALTGEKKGSVCIFAIGIMFMCSKFLDNATETVER